MAERGSAAAVVAVASASAALALRRKCRWVVDCCAGSGGSPRQSRRSVAAWRELAAVLATPHYFSVALETVLTTAHRWLGGVAAVF